MRQKLEYDITHVDEDSQLDHSVGFDNLRNKVNDLVTQVENGQLSNLHISFAGYSPDNMTIHTGNIQAGTNQLGPWSQVNSITLLSQSEENMVQAYHTLVGQMCIEMDDNLSTVSVNTHAANCDPPQPQLQFKIR